MEYNMEAPVYLTEQNGKPFLTLQGTVDIFSSEELHHAALQLLERDADAVVNCAKAEHVGAAACQILLALKDGLRAKGKHLLLQGVSAAVMNQLHVAGLTSALPPEATEI